MALSIEHKLKAFEYMVIRLAQWSIEGTQNAVLEDFNNHNDFGRDKILLFPFFICTANGDRVILFTEFCNKFYSNKLGLIDQDIEQHIDQLSKIKVGLFKTTIQAPFTQLNSKTESSVIVRMLEVQNITDEFNRIIEGIDNSIYCIKEEIPFPNFVKLNWSAISFQSKEHNSWKVYSDPAILKLYPNANIPPDFLIKEKSPFAHDEKKRIFA
jgi:hypothetical protein